MRGLAFRARRGPSAYVQKRVLVGVEYLRRINRFQPGCRSAAMRKDKTFATSYAAQDSFGITPELKHSYGLHRSKFNLKLKLKQLLNKNAEPEFRPDSAF